MKPFNLEDAKAGKKVTTRDGKPVRILCFDADSNFPLVGLIREAEGEALSQWMEDGRFFETIKEVADDLVMASEKKEGWVVILKNRGNPSRVEPYHVIFPTKEEAEKVWVKEGNHRAWEIIGFSLVEWEE